MPPIDRYLPAPRGSGRDPARDARVARDRQDVSDRDTDRIGRGAPVAAAKILVQVYDGGHIPNTGDKFFLTHPASFDGVESEGATATPVVDTTRTIPVDVLRSPAGIGDLLIAVAAGGRWVAERGGSPQPKCVAFCGPLVTIAVPTGGGFFCQQATASIAVNSDGTLGNLKLLTAGTCYIVNPTVTIDLPPAGGVRATATAIVGPVTGLALTVGGTGYLVAPVVTITDPGGTGTGATATATIDGAGHVVSLVIVTGGSLYINPKVTIAAPPPGGTQATATAVALVGQVASLTLTNAGTKYTVSNSVPQTLHFTLASPAVTIGPVQCVLGGTNPLHFGGSGVAGTQPSGRASCFWTGSTTFNVPATATCPALTNVVAAVYIWYTVAGWEAQMAFGVKYGGQICFLDFTCMLISTLADGSDIEAILIGACKTRPFSQTAMGTVSGPAVGGGGPYAAYLLLGGTCDGLTPIPLTLTLSEP